MPVPSSLTSSVPHVPGVILYLFLVFRDTCPRRRRVAEQRESKNGPGDGCVCVSVCVSVHLSVYMGRVSVRPSVYVCV